MTGATLLRPIFGGISLAPDGAGIAAPWRLYAALLAVPALLIGTFAYPNIQLETMPLSLALIALGGGAVLIAYSGRTRMFILLPLIAAYLPSRQIGFAAYLLTLAYFVAEYGGRRLVRKLDGFDYALLAVLLWCVAGWLINLGIQTDLWSLPVFLLTFGAPWLLLFIARAAPWTREDLHLIIGVWLAFAVCQLAPVYIKPLATGMAHAYLVPFEMVTVTGLELLARIALSDALDVTFGTTQSAHHLGVVLLLAVVFLAALGAARGWRGIVLLSALLGYAFLMTDSKHLVLGTLPAGALFAAVVFWPRIAPEVQRRLRFAAIVLALTAVPYFAVRAATFVVEGLWKPYFALATMNPKLQLYLRSTELLARNNLQTWVGYGPGSYATRAATIRASDVLYKEGNQLPSFIPPHTGAAYRAVAYDLYTTEFVDAIKFQSGVLTSPFSSIVGLVAEFGLLGTLVVGWLFWTMGQRGVRAWRQGGLDPPFRAAGAALVFAVPFLLVIGLFDSYLEQPDVTGPIVMVALVAMAAVDRREATEPESPIQR